jgi:hypothetical protein
MLLCSDNPVLCVACPPNCGRAQPVDVQPVVAIVATTTVALAVNVSLMS